MTLNELCQSLSSERVIELVMELGSDCYDERSDCIIFKTICHNFYAEDASMKLYYYKSNHLFHCYSGCGDSFNIIGLFERRYQLLGIKYNFYQDIVLKISGGQTLGRKELNFYQTYEPIYEGFKISEPQIDLKIYNKNILNSFSKYYPQEWLDEGITEDVMDKYDIRYCISQNKIVIPHFNLNGELIGIRGRALNEEDIEIGKYMPLTIEDKCYSHPLAFNLYGLNLIKDNIKKYKMAIIAEGEKSAMLSEAMFGAKNLCVAACGSQVHNYQIKLLLKLGVEKIIIAFDKEGDDWREQDKYFDKLNKICNKYKNLCNIGFIYDTQNLLELKDSPFDKGKETFLKLLDRSVYVK